MVERAPYLNYGESNENPFIRGSGAEPTIFIGKSPVAKDLNNILTFRSYVQAKALPEEGGIGPEPLESETPNELLEVLKDFFEEAAPQKTSDVGVSEVYVINVGPTPTITDWVEAIELSKRKKDLQIMALVGIHDISFMQTLNTYIKILEKDGLIRNGYFSVENEDMLDEDMMKYTDDTKASFIQESRIGLCEKKFFGKFIARIAVTSYYVEPGYEPFRTIPQGTFKERSTEERDALKSAGIIFGEDDPFTGDPRICLATSTAYAKGKNERPNDALFHARRNVDYQVRQVLGILALQLKRNENTDNMTTSQEDCRTYLDTEKVKERLKNYEISIVESDSDPYELKAMGQMTPVNSTHAIDFENYIAPPTLTSTSD